MRFLMLLGILVFSQVGAQTITPVEGLRWQTQTSFSKPNSFPYSSLVLKDGRILTVGETGLPKPASEHSGVFALSMRAADGSLEPEFAGGKLEAAALYSKVSYATSAVELCPSRCGELLVGGVAYVDGRQTDFALQKYNTKGQAVTAFGEKGQLLLNLGGLDALQDMQVQPDGKVLLLGYSETGSGRVGILARIDAFGVLDQGFGQGGVVRVGQSDAAVSFGQIRLWGNQIVVAGSQTKNDPKDLAVGQRIGTVWNFSPTGQMLGKPYSFEIGFFSSVKIDTSYDSLVVLALGRPQGPGPSELWLYRYGNNNARWEKQISASFPILDASLALGKDGMVYLAYSDFSPYVRLTRLNINGSSDPAFANKGAINLLAKEFSYISDMQVLSDGLLLTVASSSDNLSYSWNLVKLGL